MTCVAAAAACFAIAALIPAAWAVPTIDSNPDPISALTHLDGTIAYLYSPADVELISSGGKTYALVADAGDNAISAFDVTDPDRPVHLWSKVNGSDGTDTYGLVNAGDIDVVTIGTKTYAVVTSLGTVKGFPNSVGRDVPASSGYSGGLQIIDITDPAVPIFSSYTNQGDADANGDRFDHLAGAGSSAVFELNNKTYVATGSDAGNDFYGGMQVSDITDPDAPLAVSHVRTGDTSFGTTAEHSNLEGYGNDLDVAMIGSVPYALMTANARLTPGSSTMSGSLTVINLADPSAPAHAATIKVGETDANGRAFDVMHRPSDVLAATVGGKTYAVVSASTVDGRDGLQVVDLSAPSAPAVASSLIDGSGFDALAGAENMRVAEIGAKTYLFVPSYYANTLSIIDFSDPAAPVQVSALADEASDAVGARSGILGGASGVDVISVGDKTYAMVAASDDAGVQMLDVTDPSSPLAKGSVVDGTLGYAALKKPIHVEAVEIDSRSYIVVTDYDSNAVQLVDVTNPASPKAVSTVFNKANSKPPLFSNNDLIQMEGLKNPRGLDSFTRTIGGVDKTFVIVAADDFAFGAFVIMDVTDPENPTHVFTGRDDGNFPDSPFERLFSASDVATYEVGAKTYAAVTERAPSGAVQIVDLSDPYNPTAAALASDGEGDRQATPVNYKLKRPYGIDTFTIASGTNAGTYAAVAAIASDGVQIIKVDDPDNLEATAFVADDSPDSQGKCTVTTRCLDQAQQVKAVDVGGSPYLIVAGRGDDGVQIINVSDPTSPSQSHAVPDGYDPTYVSGSKSFTELNRPYGVDAFTLGTSVYAAVACASTANPDCSGVQLIGLDNPTQPTPAGETWDGRGSASELNGARGIAAFERGTWTYAAVAGFEDEGVQILRLGGEADSSAPVLQSAVLYDDEVLELTFDDLIDVSETDLGDFAISEPGQANQHALGSATLETDSDDITLRVRLTSALEASVKSISSPELDISVGAVENTNSVDVAAAADQGITKKATAPLYRGAVLDLSSGVLILTFDLGIDPASVDPSKMSLHDGTDGSTKYGLDGSDTLTSINPEWASVRLSEETRQEAINIATFGLKLDLEAGAVSGSSGADAAVATDLAVRVLPDDRHPLLESAVLEGNLLSMTFDETIDADRVDLSRFELTAGGSAVDLSNSAIVGSQDSPTVELRLDQAATAATLAGALFLNLDYEAVWDTSGNHLLADLGNALGQNPAIASAEATSRDSVTVQFTKPVSGTGPLHDAWRLHGSDAQGLSFVSSELDGSSIILRLGQDFPSTAPDVAIEYTRGRAPLLDAEGRELLQGRVAVSDGIPPELASARASSLTSVVVSLTEPVSGASTSGAGWAVSGLDSAGRTVTGAALGMPPDSVRLTLSGPLADTAPSISVEYSPSGGIRDLSSNPMPASSLDSVEDRIAPAFVSASLQGERSFLVMYSEDVNSTASDYVSISSGTSVRAESVTGSPGSSILVVIDPSSATFSAGAAITFTITPDVTDIAGNTLSNPGQFEISASETARVARLVLDNPGNDGRSALSLTDDTLIRTVVVERGASVDLDVSSLTSPEVAHPRVASASGGTAVFPSDLAVNVASGTVTFTSGLQVGGLGSQDLVRVGARPQASLPAGFAASVGLDASKAVTVLELGDPARTLSFSEPVRIDLAEPLSEIVYVIRPDGAKQVLSCGAEIGTPAAAEAAIAGLAGSPTSDAQACFSDASTIWAFSFSLWGSGPELPPEPVPEPEPETVAPAEQVIRRGGGGGGGGGGLRGPVAAPGPSESVYVGTISWDCSAARVTVLAGPNSDGLSVSVMSSILGSVQAQEDIEARGEDGMRKFIAPMSAEEDFLQVTAMHISARDFIQDRQSIDVDQCAGSKTFWTPPRQTSQQQDAVQVVPEDDDAVVPDPSPGPAPAQRQDGTTATQCPPGTVRDADGSCSAPELVTEPPAETEAPPVECGPGTVMTADGTCAVAPATSDQNGCLVATAAYGTELAPAVQRLREIRDGALAGTDSGAAFMSAFNSAYYAFSPVVADLERQSPAFKEAVKIAITPMIYSLQIMDGAESDPQVTAYGLAVIALNLAMYGGAPAAALYACTRRRQAAP